MASRSSFDSPSLFRLLRNRLARLLTPAAQQLAEPAPQQLLADFLRGRRRGRLARGSRALGFRSPLLHLVSAEGLLEHAGERLPRGCLGYGAHLYDELVAFCEQTGIKAIRL